MFAFFDDKLFPKIFITFEHNITNESWKQFTNKWVSYDMRERPYTFIFDTQGLGMSLMKYAWKMTVFISKLKKRKKLQNNVYLSKSIIICNNSYKRYLLEWIFYMQSPVAPVYIVKNNDMATQLYDSLSFNRYFYPSSVSAYFPKDS